VFLPSPIPSTIATQPGSNCSHSFHNCDTTGSYCSLYLHNRDTTWSSLLPFLPRLRHNLALTAPIPFETEIHPGCHTASVPSKQRYSLVHPAPIPSTIGKKTMSALLALPSHKRDITWYPLLLDHSQKRYNLVTSQVCSLSTFINEIRHNLGVLIPIPLH
jgi:hypothetical protein